MVQVNPVASTQNGQSKPHAQMDELVGDFGRYQLLIFMFKILIGVTSAFNNLGVTFYAPTNYVGYSCQTGANINTNNGLPALMELQKEPLLSLNVTSSSPSSSNYSIPNILSDFVWSEQRELRHSNVSFYHEGPKNVRKECKYKSPVDQLNHTCESYTYDTGIWISTIIDEWALVCNNSWLISLTQSLYMSGFIIAYPLFGYLSDRFGRWRTLLLGASIEMLAGFGCAFAPSIKVFMIFRLLVGIGNAGRTSSSYLVMIEWVGPKYRMHISTLGSLGWILGYCCMPWLSMYFLHFRHMQLFACFYELIFILCLLRIPESPRWLLTHRNFDQAYKVLKMAAKFNGLIVKKPKHHDKNNKHKHKTRQFTSYASHDNSVQICTVTQPETNGTVASSHDMNDQNHVSQVQPMTKKQFKVKFEHLKNMIMSKEFTPNENKVNILDLIKMKKLRVYLLILCLFWSGDSFIYYGIALRVGDFGGKNLFMSFTIAGLLEFPSIAFSLYFMRLLPRGTFNRLIFLLTGVLCSILIPLKYFEFHGSQHVTIMLAKLFNSCAFNCVLYQTMEIFPTSIRQTALSTCSVAQRIGSILAPFVKELGQVTNQYVPIMIYAGLSLVQATLVNFLPETQGADLHDTLMEAEKFEGTDKSDCHSRRTSRSCSAQLESRSTTTTTTTTTKHKS